jgi:hypothetical protein
LTRISITPAVFDVIAATLPDSVSFERAEDRAERMVWLDLAIVNRLPAMRGPGEGYSDVILRVAAHAG